MICLAFRMDSQQVRALSRREYINRLEAARNVLERFSGLR